MSSFPIHIMRAMMLTYLVMHFYEINIKVYMNGINQISNEMANK